MAKLLVLMDGSGEEIAETGEAIVQGARSVRFAEAELMRLTGDASSPRIQRLRVLAGSEALTGYDAVVLGASGEGLDRMADLLRKAEGLGLCGRLANRLGSIFPASTPDLTGDAHPLWSLLAPMSRYGMILVPPGYAGPSGEAEGVSAAARRLGKRLIDIAGWINHARSHHHH